MKSLRKKRAEILRISDGFILVISGDLMAGHSKWANTKYRKASQDAKRDKIFTKIICELVTAAKLGGCNPDFNSRLRSVIDKALANNMTRPTINRAIMRGIGRNDDLDMKSIIYEGYGPGGTAVMIECLSDNCNRTMTAVRQVFMKNDGKLGSYGSVSYLFTKKGMITYAPGIDENTLMEFALAAGAEDIVSHNDNTIDVFISWECLGVLKDALSDAGFNASVAKITMISSTKVQIDVETSLKLFRLVNMLKDCDDVQAVYHNGDISK